MAEKPAERPDEKYGVGLKADGELAIIDDFDEWKRERDAWEAEDPDDISDLDKFDGLFAEGTQDKFRESEHPRGQPKNAGQFASKPGGGAGPADIHSDLSVTYEGSKARQPVESLDDLYEKAKAAEAPFKKACEKVASETGGEVVYTPPEYAEPGTILKSRKSAQRKLHAELGGDASELKDVIRATVVHHRWEQTRAAAAAFIAQHHDNIVRVKDRVANPLAGGYRDLLINYRTDNGLVAEVQFNTRAMVEAKNGEGHKLYEQLRMLIAIDKPPPPATVAEIEHLEKAQSAVYEYAYQASGNGDWGKKK